MPLTWNTKPSVAFPKMYQAWSGRVFQSVYQLALRYAPEIEGWMKTRAPWMDRTGTARRSLHAWVQAGTMKISIYMDFGPEAPYGTYLEYSHAGKYAIVSPTIDEFEPRVMADIQALLK